MAYGRYKRKTGFRKRFGKRRNYKRRRYNNSRVGGAAAVVRNLLAPKSTHRVKEFVHFNLNAGVILAAQTPVGNRCLLQGFGGYMKHAGLMNAIYGGTVAAAEPEGDADAPALTDLDSRIYCVKEYLSMLFKNNEKHPVSVMEYNLYLKEDIPWKAKNTTLFPLSANNTGDGTLVSGYFDATTTDVEEKSVNTDISINYNYTTANAYDLIMWTLCANLVRFSKTSVSHTDEESFFYTDSNGKSHGMSTTPGWLNLRNRGPYCKKLFSIKLANKYYLNPGDQFTMHLNNSKPNRIGSKGIFVDKVDISAAAESEDRILIQKGYRMKLLYITGSLSHKSDNDAVVGRGFVQLDCEWKHSTHFSWSKDLDNVPKGNDSVSTHNWTATALGVPVAPSAMDIETHSGP